MLPLSPLLVSKGLLDSTLAVLLKTHGATHPLKLSSICSSAPEAPRPHREAGNGKPTEIMNAAWNSLASFQNRP